MDKAKFFGYTRRNKSENKRSAPCGKIGRIINIKTKTYILYMNQEVKRRDTIVFWKKSLLH